MKNQFPDHPKSMFVCSVQCFSSIFYGKIVIGNNFVIHTSFFRFASQKKSEELGRIERKPSNEYRKLYYCCFFPLSRLQDTEKKNCIDL